MLLINIQATSWLKTTDSTRTLLPMKRNRGNSKISRNKLSLTVGEFRNTKEISKGGNTWRRNKKDNNKKLKLNPINSRLVMPIKVELPSTF